MSAPDRETYGARQAQLLDALLRGDRFPAGFDAAQAGAAGDSLRRKRGHAVALAWPALALALGEAYGARFDAHARAVDAPPAGNPLADGLGFARSLQRDELTDDARVELLLARAALRRDRGGRWRARRTPFAAAARLGAPRPRTLIVVALPWLGHRYLAIARRARSGTPSTGIPHVDPRGTWRLSATDCSSLSEEAEVRLRRPAPQDAGDVLSAIEVAARLSSSLSASAERVPGRRCR